MILPIDKKRIKNDYLKNGMWSFGSRRDSGKRKHAGTDFYCDEGTIIRAIESGIVIDSSDFYLGTEEVQIAGKNYIARYGEVKSLVKKGQTVEKGQIIATVKKCKGLKTAMLHLELYADTNDLTPLTTGDKPFFRRADLINSDELLRG